MNSSCVRLIERSPKNSSSLPIATTSVIEYEVSLLDVQETLYALLDQCCQIVDQTLVSSSPPKTKREEKIAKLERRLSRLSRIIQELEEKDMSLDEMAHCDLYEVEANLKEEACFVYAKLTKLKSQPNNTERIINKKISLTGNHFGCFVRFFFNGKFVF